MAAVHPQIDIIFRQERAFEKFETQTHVFHLPNTDCILLTPHPKASKNCEKLGMTYQEPPAHTDTCAHRYTS